MCVGVSRCGRHVPNLPMSPLTRNHMTYPARTEMKSSSVTSEIMAMTSGSVDCMARYNLCLKGLPPGGAVSSAPPRALRKHLQEPLGRNVWNVQREKGRDVRQA